MIDMQYFCENGKMERLYEFLLSGWEGHIKKLLEYEESFILT